jgi:regulator of cell morphogenesis and NO signaling
MLTDYSDSAIGELVNKRPERAMVFERCGIDFCCGGQRTLAAACRQAGANVEYVCRELAALDQQLHEVHERDWTRCSLSGLVDEIVDHHHAYLRTELPRLEALFRKVVAAHATAHPELRNAHSIFQALASELSQHMLKEERVLFPVIKALETAQQLRRALPVFHCGSVSNPIGMMVREHREAGDALHAIRRLTHEFTPPADACPTYRALLAGLLALERDLHLHIHKENNLLFPRAAELESQLAAV